MAKSIKKLLKSFTLIELIIVIAIIAVLGATAFLLLTQWMSKGRDAQRISDLNVIQNALNIQITQADSLPIPDSFNTVTYTGEIVLYQGKFGSGVVSKITTLTKLPKDRTNGEYEYSLLSDRLTYKVQAIMENNNYKTSFVQGVFADELYYRYVGKDLRGIIIGNDFVYLPNMFLTGYVNGQYDLGSGMNVFLGNKVGEYVSGGIIDKDDEDGIISMMTGLGLSTNEATSIFSKATGVSTSTSGTEQPTGPVGTNGECGTANGKEYESNITTYGSDIQCEVGESTDLGFPGEGETKTRRCSGVNGGAESEQCSASRKQRCSNTYSSGEYHTDWNITTEMGLHNNKCYVFGDEDDNAKAACNKWVTDNVTLGGEFVWVPARWFVTDGNGTGMKDIFYQRSINFNGKDYVCRGFAIAKYEMSYKDLTSNPSNAGNGGWNTYSYLTYTTGQGGFVSKQGYPIANINQGQAINACRSIGTNYHLITNNEWMVSARNIEQQGNNWISGIKLIDGLYRGISDDTTYGCVGQDDDNEWGVPSTNLSCTRRIHTISNNNQIRDMSGNVWEHVDRGNKPNTVSVNIGNGNLCLASDYWHVNGNPSTSCAESYGPIYNGGGSDIGMGYVQNSSGTDKIFLRGAPASNAAWDGVFALAIYRGSAAQSATTGFRCTR